MKEMRSVIPPGWYAAGANALWGISRSTTFAFVPPDGLPELPHILLDGTFSWLPALAPRSSPLHYQDEFGGVNEGRARLDRLQEEAHARGLVLPEPFIRFMTTQQIHSRVPSITGCYLDISGRLLDDLSDSDGPLVRFLTDSQECVAWYLQLAADGGSRVVATWDLHYSDHDELVPDVGRAHVVSPGFETFVHRFWVENLLWLKVTRNEAPTSDELDYLSAARRAASLVEAANEDGQ